MLTDWRRGDETAGNRLMRRHFHTLYRFFRVRAGRNASDLIQRTLLAAVESRDKIRQDASFRAYLIGIARRQMAMFLRSKKRDPVLKDPAEDFLGHLDSPSGAVALRQEQRLLLRALRTLSQEQQLTLELFYWEGMSLQEIAEALDLEEASVKTRLYRARKLLRTRILEIDPVTGHTTVQDFDRWAKSIRRLLDKMGGETGDGDEPD